MGPVETLLEKVRADLPQIAERAEKQEKQLTKTQKMELTVYVMGFLRGMAAAGGDTSPYLYLLVTSGTCDRIFSRKEEESCTNTATCGG